MSFDPTPPLRVSGLEDLAPTSPDIEILPLKVDGGITKAQLHNELVRLETKISQAKITRANARVQQTMQEKLDAFNASAAAIQQTIDNYNAALGSALTQNKA